MELVRMHLFDTKIQLDNFCNRLEPFHPKMYSIKSPRKLDGPKLGTGDFTWYEPAGHFRFFDPPRQKWPIGHGTLA